MTCETILFEICLKQMQKKNILQENQVFADVRHTLLTYAKKYYVFIFATWSTICQKKYAFLLHVYLINYGIKSSKWFPQDI